MKNFFVSLRPLNHDVAALLLRLLFGGLFIWHGYQKIEAYDQYVGMFPDLIGVGGRLSYQLVIFAEFGCGILVTLGLLTRLTVLPIMFCMCIAYFMAHKADAFDKKELVFVFLWMSVIVFILGSGKYSLDSVLFKNKTKKYA